MSSYRSQYGRKIWGIKAGKGLDILIAIEVMDWQLKKSDGVFTWPRGLQQQIDWVRQEQTQAICIDGPYKDMLCPPLSTDISAAWQVIEKFKSSSQWLDFCEKLCVMCDIPIYDGDDVIHIAFHVAKLFERLTPGAICKAALLATI